MTTHTYPTLFRYSFRIPVYGNDVSRYCENFDSCYSTIRYDTVHRFEIGEIVHLPMDNNLELS